MCVHCRRSTSPLTREVTWLAVEQFLPAVVAGGLLTYALTTVAPESVWLLPGLWQVLFSLGVFASCRLLPRATFGVGIFYMAAGLMSLVWALGEAALSPWAMGLPFGIGQLPDQIGGHLVGVELVVANRARDQDARPSA